MEFQYCKLEIFLPESHLEPLRAALQAVDAGHIGAYDSCPNGCLYCYANRTPQKARANFRLHDPASPLLIGNLQPGDQLTCGAQKSFLR